MPNINTYCNVRFPTYIGDSVCDVSGGYNTQECDYDGGDCCRQSCLQNSFNLLCGISEYTCIDPQYNILPTITPTQFPTISPTYTPTLFPTTQLPTLSPTFTPTQFPTLSPTSTPTLTPTNSPTLNPTYAPTKIIIQRTYSNDNDSNKGVITVLIVLLCLITIMFGGYVYRHKYHTQQFQINPQHTGTMHYNNPVYESNAINEEQSDEVYQDVNFDNIDDTYYTVSSQKSEENFMN